MDLPRRSSDEKHVSGEHAVACSAEPLYVAVFAHAHLKQPLCVKTPRWSVDPKSIKAVTDRPLDGETVLLCPRCCGEISSRKRCGKLVLGLGSSFRVGR